MFPPLLSDLKSGCKSLLGFFESYGFTTLLILFLVYWSQGFKHFGVLAITYYFKDNLDLEPATAQYIWSVSQIAWYLKPLYGMVSDNFPIYGNHRKPYLFLAGGLGIAAYLSFLRIQTPMSATLALMMSELSQVIADVIADAIVIQESRRTGSVTSTTLQTFCLFSMSLGGLVGGPLGGLALELYSPQTIIASQAICPCLLLLAAVLFSERYEEAHSKKKIKQRCRDLMKALFEPSVLRPVLFIFLVNGCTPGIGQVIVYFYRDQVKFTATFIALIQTMGYATIGVGSLLYTTYLRHIQYRDILTVGQILVFSFGLFELALVTGFNSLLSLPDTWTAVMGDSFSTTLTFTFRTMPLMVVSSAVCPLGAEATLFSLISSVQYFGLFVSEVFGGVLTGWFDVTEGKYENLWILLVIKSLMCLLPLLCLDLIPENVDSPDSSEFQDLIANSPSTPVPET